VIGNGHRILRQGDRPRTALVEEFRRDVDSVLLGTESFWAGVDVQGEALSCVVIDRLPFPSPDDPVLDAITERDPRWFTNYSLPRAVIAFKQGFGRLIRSSTDRGVVVVLDQRLVSKYYGKVFVRSLPPVLKSQRIENVQRFLDQEAP
jgi:ATP-dependent DNA helicase DinG